VAASPNFVYRAFQTPNDEFFASQWHYEQIKLDLAWGVTQGSANVTVAIIDTGMILSHPDFAGRLVAGNGFDFISDPARARDGDGLDADPTDAGDRNGGGSSTFHGTHVGGTVGATTNNTKGVAGVDWNCKLVAVRVLGVQGGTLQDIAEGVRYAAGLSNASGTTRTRVDVINMSLGGPGNAAVLENACNAAADAGALVVCAAGNDGTATPHFPASYDKCLSVGSTRFDQQRAPYSNFASTVDIWAPGGDTSVDQNDDGFPDGVLSCLADDSSGSVQLGYGFLQGTSMASPHVAGVAALLKAAKPNATADELRAALIQNANAGNDPGPLVDANAAVRAISGTPGLPAILAAPNAVKFTGTQTTARTNLTNPGTGTVTVDTNIQITYQQGSGWLSAALVAAGGGANISHSALDLTVDRSGLADGEYKATVQVNGTAGGSALSATVSVTLVVGAGSPVTDTIFVILVNADTFATVYQAETNNVLAFVYGAEWCNESACGPTVNPGRYILAAGTDRDDDDLLGDEGELFGIWPNRDSPLVLELTSGRNLTGIDFLIESVVRPTSIGGASPFRRLR
jgi:serine protease